MKHFSFYKENVAQMSLKELFLWTLLTLFRTGPLFVAIILLVYTLPIENKAWSGLLCALAACVALILSPHRILWKKTRLQETWLIADPTAEELAQCAEQVDLENSLPQSLVDAYLDKPHAHWVQALQDYFGTHLLKIYADQIKPLVKELQALNQMKRQQHEAHLAAQMDPNADHSNKRWYNDQKNMIEIDAQRQKLIGKLCRIKEQGAIL
ncbi:hypothetical protein [Lactobacillus selangorensis]|nr:hypothetical protein [Lactobacillus selangorensis]